MKFDYRNAQNTALGLIDNFGGDFIIVRTSSDFDPATGKVSNLIQQQQTAKGVTVPDSEANDDKFIKDQSRGRLRLFYVAAKGLEFEPRPGDMFLFENNAWDVAGVTPLKPAGLPVMYTLTGRESGREITGQIVEALGCMNIVKDEW